MYLCTYNMHQVYAIVPNSLYRYICIVYVVRPIDSKDNLVSILQNLKTQQTRTYVVLALGQLYPYICHDMGLANNCK